MILDALLLFTGGTGGSGNGDGSTDSPTTGTQFSSNVIDLGGPALPPSGLIATGATPTVPGRDLGIGDDPALKLLVQVTVAFTAGASLQVNISGAPDNGSGGVGSYQVLASGQVVTESLLVAGARLLDIDMPRTGPLSRQPPRWLRLGYVNGAGTHSTGKLQGYIVLDRMDQIEHTSAVMSGYPAGIIVAN